MTTILDKILKEKEREVLFLQQNYRSPDQLSSQSVPSITESFRQSSTLNIIAEIKRASPSKGNIDLTIDPVKQAKRYEQLGAAAISVLTDEAFFKGSISDLQAVSKAVSLPILCKDFIIDPIQIERAKDHGATIILLIVAALSKEKLQYLYQYASERELDILVEVHDEEELAIALEIGAEIIGVNNRNLKTFEVDLAVTERLAANITNDKILMISESGLRTREEVNRVKKVGVEGILVGETLMRAPNLQAAFEEFNIPI